MPNKPTIGKLLKQFTLDTGISQKEVAEKTGYSTQRINNYYRDLVKAPDEFLSRFKETFGKDLEMLFEKEKSIKSFPTAYNPIPVFDLDAKPIKEPDFFKFNELVSYYIDVPMFADCTAGLRVGTTTMQPELLPNDVIVMKRINNLDLIEYGDIFFIICEGVSFIRYIRRNEADTKKVILKAADNNFDDIILKKTDILFLFQIRGKITRF